MNDHEDGFEMLSMDLLVYSGRNPRQEMRGIEEFAESIKEYGIIQPITVRPKDDKFEIVVGERRVRAAIIAGFKEIKAQIKKIDDATADELRLVENIFRDDLTEAEKGDAILSLLENQYDKYPSFKAIADKLKVNYWTMTTHWLPKARRASPYLKHLISRDRVLESQVLALLKYEPHIQDVLVKKIMEHSLNREQTIKFLKLYDEQGGDNLDDLAKEVQGIQRVSLFVDELPPEVAKVVTDIVEQRERPNPPQMVGESKTKMLDSLRDTMERKKKGREKAQVKLASNHTEIAQQLGRNVQEQIESAMSKAPEKADRIAAIVDEEIGGLRKRLEIFPEKSRKIQPRFDKFQTLLERGVIPYSVWDFPYRDDYAGDKDFHGNCSPQIVEQCIWRLTEEGDLVVDPMAGSGTALDVCRAFNRRCIGYDIKPPANREDIIQNDSRNIPLEDNSVDMVFIHPPYWNLVYFTKAEEKLPDLSRAATAEQFIELLREVFQECRRILITGKFMCVLLGDLIRDGSFIPLCRKATNMAKELGFIDYGYAVKLAHGEMSRKKSGVILAEPLYTDNLKISHDLVMFFKKEE